MSTLSGSKGRSSLAPQLLTKVLLSIFICATIFAGTPVDCTERDHQLAVADRLEAGEVVVDSEDIHGTKYVVGRILIDETPEKLWPVVVNPFEFQGKICHRMKSVKVITDQSNVSVLSCKVGVVFPIPDLEYVVESRYTACKRIEFKRIRGSLRDFRGFWGLTPSAHGTKTEVTYSMYLDPGFPVPEWIVRQGCRNELPTVLTGLRKRVNELKGSHGVPAKHNIAAAFPIISALPVSNPVH